MKSKGIVAGLMALCFSANVMAADIMVSVESNGVLRAEGMEPGTTCDVEWTQDLQNSFNTNNPSFRALTVDSNGVVEVAIPIFFRVKGTPAVEEPTVPEGMVQIPAGTNSGTNPLGVGEVYSEYYPETYSLTVDAFYMDATEVTKAQWDAVYTWAVANGYSFSNAGLGKETNHPVHTVNWYDCVKWCNARSEKDGKTPCYTVSSSTYKTGESEPDCNFAVNGYRLPTSDEWEYAARGGLSGNRFPWGDVITHKEANYKSSSVYTYDVSSTRDLHPDYKGGVRPHTSPVDAFAANGYGLYDMAGNVWEWCWDSNASDQRTTRGGNWINQAWTVRCGGNSEDKPDAASDGRGVRAVCR